jgi:hypothetical protein
VLAVCGWHLHLMAPVKSAQLRWDDKKTAGVDPHRAVLFCTTCGVKAGLWFFLPLGSDLGNQAGTRRSDW